jgi:uncharacterized protein (DUF488 family)
MLVDVRRFPRSKRNPQFNIERLKVDVPEKGICYIHIENLGGRRGSSAEKTRNAGWRNASFRAYADYLDSEEFEDGLNELKKLESRVRRKNGTIALMCAESLPWRCHRFLISDVLTANGYLVQHILPSGKSMTHKITPFAKIKRQRNGKISLTYPRLNS